MRIKITLNSLIVVTNGTHILSVVLEIPFPPPEGAVTAAQFSIFNNSVQTYRTAVVEREGADWIQLWAFVNTAVNLRKWYTVP
jgi:hypothetical protein